MIVAIMIIAICIAAGLIISFVGNMWWFEESRFDKSKETPGCVMFFGGFLLFAIGLIILRITFKF